jgi:hypothetical protein
MPRSTRRRRRPISWLPSSTCWGRTPPPRWCRSSGGARGRASGGVRYTSVVDSGRRWDGLAIQKVVGSSPIIRSRLRDQRTLGLERLLKQVVVIIAAGAAAAILVKKSKDTKGGEDTSSGRSRSRASRRARMSRYTPS